MSIALERRRYMGASEDNPLPSGYTKISYISNTIASNGAYIDFGIKPSNTDVISITFQFTDTSNYSNWPCILGTKVTGKRIGFMLNNDGSTWGLRWGASAASAGTIDTNKHTLTIDSGVFTLDGDTLADLGDSDFTAGLNITAFVENVLPTFSAFAVARIYSLSIGERVYVPCYRRNGLIVGLYETTYGEFLTSASSVPIGGGV